MLRWILAVTSVLCLSFPALAESQAPRLLKGELDLRAFDLESMAPLSISGEIEFFWNRFITQDEIESGDWIDYPGSWDVVGNYPRYGYASYRMRIKLAKRQAVTLRIGQIPSAWTLFVDGVAMASAGTPGTTAESTQDERNPTDILTFEPQTENVTLIIHVANFGANRSGSENPMSIGGQKQVLMTHFIDIARGFLLWGALLMMGVYHLVLYLLRRSNISALYFALHCIASSLYVLGSDDAGIFRIFGVISYLEFKRTFILGWILGTVFFVFYFASIFPLELDIKVPKALTAASLFVIVALFQSPLQQMSLIGNIYQIITLLLLFPVLTAGYKALVREREGARVFVVGLIIIVSTLVHDILLAEGFIESQYLGSDGIFLFVISQSYLLSIRYENAYKRVESSESENRYMADEIKVQRDALVRLTDTLESRVSEQTYHLKKALTEVEQKRSELFAKNADLESIFHSSTQGMFKIALVDDRIMIDVVRSDATYVIFGNCERTQAVRFDDYILKKAELSKAQKAQITSILFASIGEDAIAFQASSHLLPRELRIKVHGEWKSVALSWTAIYQRFSTIVDTVLLTAVDVTEQRLAESERDTEREKNECIADLLSATKVHSLEFLRSMTSLLIVIRQEITDTPSMDTIHNLFIYVHSIKGTALSLAFRKISSIAHAFEHKLYSQRRSGQITITRRELESGIESIAEAVSFYEGIMRDLLSWEITEDDQLEIPVVELQELFESNLIIATSILDEQERYPQLYAGLRWIFPDLRSILAGTISKSGPIAAKLGKPMPTLIFEGANPYFGLSVNRLLSMVFGHLLNNSLDHGIEVPATRKLRRKSAQGKILVSSILTDTQVEIRWSDDGAGLDLQKLRDQAQELFISSKDLQGQIQNMIFLPGFSTRSAAEVTEVSGRGVGLHAVLSDIRHVGGDVAAYLGEEIEAGRYRLELVISLPAALVSPLTRESAQRPSNIPSSNLSSDFWTERGTVYRALVIDDDPIQQKIAAAILKKSGLSADMVGSGEEALFKASAVHYDLIIIDLNLGHESGFDVSRKIIDLFRETSFKPIIVGMTATRHEEEIASLASSGMIDILQKPIDRNRVDEIIYGFSRPYLARSS